MADYKEMYLKLSRKVNKAIILLQEVQEETDVQPENKFPLIAVIPLGRITLVSDVQPLNTLLDNVPQIK